MIARLHVLFARLGISPKIGDQLLGTVVLIAFNWAVYGQPLDVEGLRLAVGLFILGAIGVAAPPAPGIKQHEVSRRGIERVERRRRANERGASTIEVLLIVLVVVVIVVLLADRGNL